VLALRDLLTHVGLDLLRRQQGWLRRFGFSTTFSADASRSLALYNYCCPFKHE
jgi:hypothetical protein